MQLLQNSTGLQDRHGVHDPRVGDLAHVTHMPGLAFKPSEKDLDRGSLIINPHKENKKVPKHSLDA